MMGNTAMMRTVFLSSTSRDLHAHRDAAYKAIEGLRGYHCVRMEDFGAWDKLPDDFCRTRVAECDLFVCIAGPLYGSLSPAGPSFTEREYDAAVEANKPCLIFLTAANFPLAGDLREPDEKWQRQIAFRKKLADNHMREEFSTPEQLANLVIQAIRNWEQEIGAASCVRLRRVAPIQDREPTEFKAYFVSIGRNPQSMFSINDPEVSWDHGQIVFMRGQYYYRHVSQTNATKLFQRGVQKLLRPGSNEEVPLTNQDRLVIGSTTLAVEFNLVNVDRGYVPTTPEGQP
jgi:hypothetical protein